MTTPNTSAEQIQRLTRAEMAARRQQEALQRAENGQSLMNYGAIIDGFTERGIPAIEISPRENIFTFNAWKAKGRFVRKGEHGVKIVTWISKTRRDEETGEERVSRYCTNSTVFHISQTTEAK